MRHRQLSRELRIDVYNTGDCISEDKRVRVGPRATVTIAQRILPLTRSLLSNVLTVIRSRRMLWAPLSIGGATLAPYSEHRLRHREIP